MSCAEFSVHKGTSAGDMKFALDLARMEDWGVGIYDHEMYFSVDPEGFYYGQLGDEKVSSILALKYGKNEYCCIGLYLVKKELRGQSYGRETWDLVWSEIPDSCVVSLSSVLNMVTKYEEYGFKTLWKEFTYSFDAEKVAALSLPPSCADLNIVPFEEADFASLVKYDTSVFCYCRENWLKKMLDIPNCMGWVAMNKAGEILGYCLARVTLEKHGWWIHPLSVENISVAQALINKMAFYVKEQPIKKITATIPAINKPALDLLLKASPDLILESARMFARGAPETMVENHKNRMFFISANIG